MFKLGAESCQTAVTETAMAAGINTAELPEATMLSNQTLVDLRDPAYAITVGVFILNVGGALLSVGRQAAAKRRARPAVQP